MVLQMLFHFSLISAYQFIKPARATAALALFFCHLASANNFSSVGASLPGLDGGATVWGDYDNDGDLDILLTGIDLSGIRRSEIYRNDGANSFTSIAAGLPGVDFSSVAWGDYDNDGDLDFILAGWTGSIRIADIYENNGNNTFSVSSSLAGVSGGSVAWGDYDNDGDLDILLTGFRIGGQVSEIYRNDSGAFTTINASLPGVDLGTATWGDFDADGDLDILLIGGTSAGTRVSEVYRNDSGTFAPISAGLPGVNFGSAVWGDYDNDGDLDIALAGWTGSNVVTDIYRNDGTTAFTAVNTGLPGINRSSMVWGDFDNDGDLDLLLTGWTGSSRITDVYYNNSGIFTAGVEQLPGSTLEHCALGCADYDEDGDLDILFSGETSGGKLSDIYRNSIVASANVPPSAPSALAASNLTPTTAMLSWNAAADDTTPILSLSYRLRVGTTLGGQDVLSPMSDLASGKDRLSTHAPVIASSWVIQGLTPNTTYYWSVQAIDQGLVAGPFATEGSFTTLSADTTPPVATIAPISDPHSGPVGQIDIQFDEIITGIDIDDFSLFRDGNAIDVSGLSVVEVDGSSYRLDLSSVTGNAGAYTLTLNASGSGIADLSGNLLAVDASRQFSVVLHFAPIGANLSAVSLSSASWGDYDNDGDLDIVMTGPAADGSPSTGIYENSGGSFTSISTNIPGILIGSADWGDYDKDGDLDILLTGDTGSGFLSEIYVNDGSGGFLALGAGLVGMRDGFAAWGDYDNDGDLDILLGGSNGASEQTKIYRNDGGSFTDIFASLPGSTYSSGAWGDYDNDGDLDILLTGTMGSRIYQNNNGIFSNINAGLTDINRGGASWGDYDNDGDLDLILSGRTSTGEITEIYQNTGGVFSAISSSIPGLRNSSVAWGDYDNDGNLDILVSGATSGGAIKISEVYRNEGNNTFTSINAGMVGVARSSAVWGDYNNDGKLDILLTGTTGDENFAEIYQNISTLTPNSPPAAPATLATENITNDHIMLSWIAPTDDSTPSVALGYRLRVGTAPGAQDIVSPMSNLTAGKEVLAALAPIKGTNWIINGLAYSTTYYWSVQAIDHTLAAGLFATEGSFTTPPPPFGVISSGLSPLSAISVDWGDYDNDGDLDLLLTGKSGSSKSSDIYRNDNGVFMAISAGLPGLSDGSAKWGDFDNDGDLDILLTGEDSGGVISSEVYLNTGGTFAAFSAGLPGVKSGSSVWGDYDNDGDLDILLNGISSTTRTTDIFRNNNGTFTCINAGLPEVISSSVAWGDYDKDGDLDILLTGSATSESISEIFRNDGGSFVAIDAGITPVDFSSAAWGDYDNDGDLDVLITGLSSSGRMSEVYRNDGGSFTSINAGLPGVDLGSSSWGDFDNDGDLDILLTGSTESGNLSDVFVNEAGIFAALNTNLAAVSLGAAAWADYDNDADLDLILTGASGSSTGPAFSDIYRNDSVASPNAVPNAPVGISAGPTFTKSAVLNWTAPTDDTTPVDALTYRLRIGTTPGAQDVLSPMSNLTTGENRLASLGSINGTSWSIKNLVPLTTYYWSVQASDHSLASGPFAIEGSFTTTDYPANAVEATAHYPLDGNVNDLISGYHGAASSTDLSWQTEGTRSFASLGDDGSIALPLSLTENLLENGVMEFNFDFRITEADLGNSGIRNELIFAIKESGSSAMWQNAGFMFLAQFPVDPSEPYKLIFSLQDSFSPTGYLWKDIGTGQNLIANEWVNVRLSIGTNSRVWRIEVNGVESTGNLDPDFNIEAFTTAIQSNIATVGGQLGSHHPGWTVDFDFDNLTVYDSSDIKIPQLTNAYSELVRDIQGLVTHTEVQKQTYLNTIKEVLPFVTFSQVSADLYAYTAAYEAANPPLYQDGVVLYDDELPIHGQAVLFSQEFIFKTQYSPVNVENMAGVVFEHSEVIPGAVPSNTPRLTDAVAKVNGTYQSDPAFRHGDDHLVLRPTGYFAAPGEVVTITVPESVVSSGLSVVVGAHIRNMVPENIGRINRFKDISAEYPMDSTQIKVVSPFGGGIYLGHADKT